MIELITAIFAAYIITAVLVNGAIFFSFRAWLRTRTPWLVKGRPPRHLVDCRMCVGFWVSLTVWCFFFSLQPSTFSLFFVIYGASYFLATQER